jgi:aspartate carbamoyltransferase catalytic subunit
MLFLGGTYISFGHPEMTKASAGETLEDTVRVLEGYADILAIRHPRDDAAATAAGLVAAPVINAGCGTLEHPTQALLDLYTIHVAFGAIDGLTIGLMGDLRLQRTVNSLIMALSNFNVTLHLISHPSRRLRPETARYLDNRVKYHETDSFEDILPTLNVLYTIRIDRDRTSGPEDYSSLRGGRRLTAHDLSVAKNDLLILNPLPRDDELHPDVDATSHAFYFQQAHMGRQLRAALIAMMLDRTPVSRPQPTS